ncbi:hypothetical protein AB0J82_34770 [Asanoa sp. NPDC049518]|uniref:hypothetical protein n=1 Tax=unclassified Asanoa TaxID=2685164 RepID=UPI0034219918
MEFTGQLDALQSRVATAKTDVQAAAVESREQLKKRVDQVGLDLDQAVKKAQQQADQASPGARSKWEQMRADAAAKREGIKAKIDKRNREMDAEDAAMEANWAEADAADAINFAGRAVESAEVAILDAISARAYAAERAKAAGS